jgi:hypothetical protein
MAILESYFGLKVDPIDEGGEDFKIFEGEGQILAVGEAKGTNSGIKREHINQVDSHREKLDLTDSTPGLLIINNQMDIASVQGRRETTIAPEHIKHARLHNVLVLRAIDLLTLMQWAEGRADRGQIFIKYVTAGGGWLTVDGNGPKVVES